MTNGPAVQADCESSFLELLFEPASRPAALSKLMVVAAHPQDEILGLGGSLAALPALTFVHVTDGSPRDLLERKPETVRSLREHARAERMALQTALSLSGVRPTQMRQLGCTEREAIHNLAPLALRLLDLVELVRPHLIFTHAYDGGHPDHDATAFLAHAVAHLAAANGHRIELVEIGGCREPHLPGSSGLFPVPAAETGTFTRSLSEKETALKLQMLACFPEPRAAAVPFPAGTEVFRIAPAYDFTAPPSPHGLLYEGCDWGASASALRTLFLDAMAELGIEDSSRF